MFSILIITGYPLKDLLFAALCRIDSLLDHVDQPAHKPANDIIDDGDRNQGEESFKCAVSDHITGPRQVLNGNIACRSRSFKQRYQLTQKTGRMYTSTCGRITRKYVSLSENPKCI